MLVGMIPMSALAAEGDYMKNRTIKIFSAVLLGVMLIVIAALSVSASGTATSISTSSISSCSSVSCVRLLAGEGGMIASAGRQVKRLVFIFWFLSERRVRLI